MKLSAGRLTPVAALAPASTSLMCIGHFCCAFASKSCRLPRSRALRAAGRPGQGASWFCVEVLPRCSLVCRSNHALALDCHPEVTLEQCVAGPAEPGGSCWWQPLLHWRLQQQHHLAFSALVCAGCHLLAGLHHSHCGWFLACLGLPLTVPL